MFLGASDKGPGQQGKRAPSRAEARDDGAAEATAQLQRTQNKQHTGRVMGPPVKSKG